MPIKRKVVEEIGTAIPVGKGKEKKIKKETVKKSKVEEGVVGTIVGQGTKKRKTGSTRKQLVIFKDPREMDPAAEKEVNHPPIPKIRVKTKVKTSILQIIVGSLKGISSMAVTSSTPGSSRYTAIVPYSP